MRGKSMLIFLTLLFLTSCENPQMQVAQTTSSNSVNEISSNAVSEDRHINTETWTDGDFSVTIDSYTY